MSDKYISQALAELKQGGVIAYPTEAVYGLGCDPRQKQSIEKLLKIKQRTPEKGLILIASDVSQILSYIEVNKISDEVWKQVQSSWPGPVTWLLPAKASISELIRGNHKTIAIRVSSHPLVKKLCDAFGQAIISTSANCSGQPPARTADEVRDTFGEKLDYILEGDVGESNNPTEIRDALSGKIIRPSE